MTGQPVLKTASTTGCAVASLTFAASCARGAKTGWFTSPTGCTAYTAPHIHASYPCTPHARIRRCRLPTHTLPTHCQHSHSSTLVQTKEPPTHMPPIPTRSTYCRQSLAWCPYVPQHRVPTSYPTTSKKPTTNLNPNPLQRFPHHVYQ